ncbi:uncharacterized protein AMSG_07727 [Thecamonas trahens ATCC 50062]|uniref:Ankyrin n=1 Tax=Thecamonas trahens ATCC 50062 TaxID=461836 RepID=A0A0L0DH43_THETB|nr:hypothetical protein AMSG_07727 [Thecamonas trahens ATCC 50062]KNC51664.1 hypothetical protein AMSG_07727 [Thecamonas trahens ATCC 50062]|eukprot:XP_013755799.1 hypothetical protein AMSG_07727 [Thecamonas trahens ATCC 50062]
MLDKLPTEIIHLQLRPEATAGFAACVWRQSWGGAAVALQQSRERAGAADRDLVQIFVAARPGSAAWRKIVAVLMKRGVVVREGLGRRALARGPLAMPVLAILYGLPSVAVDLLPAVEDAAERATCLVAAAQSGHRELVELLAREEMGDSVMEEAVKCAACAGHAELVAWMVRSFEIPAQHLLVQALKEAVANNETKVAAALLAHPDLSPSIEQNTLVITAAKSGHANMVKMLLSSPGASYLSVGRIFLDAMDAGDIDMVRALIDAGAASCVDLDRADELLVDACAAGRADMIELVLANLQLDPNITYHSCYYPYVVHFETYYAAIRHGHADVVRLLLAHPSADITADRTSLIQRAEAEGHPEIARLLASHRPRRPLRNAASTSSGRSPQIKPAGAKPSQDRPPKSRKKRVRKWKKKRDKDTIQ